MSALSPQLSLVFSKALDHTCLFTVYRLWQFSWRCDSKLKMYSPYIITPNFIISWPSLSL